MPICLALETARLRLRSWRPADAAELHAILAANHARLSPWIPARVADPASPSALAERLARFAVDFAADQEWRYAMVGRADGRIVGELSVFPRSEGGRVPLARADRAELGYWLQLEATGQGYVTEAVRALLALLAAEPQFRHVEIHCDARNAASAAVPRRLGFVLRPCGVSGDAPRPDRTLQVWEWHRPSAGVGDQR